MLRLLVLSDLHIQPNSNLNSTKWAEHFCQFIKGGKCCEDIIIVVLGDIINNDGHSAEQAFDSAENIFDYIFKELSSIHFRLFFIPGNHDYCNGNLKRFDSFCNKFSNGYDKPFLFSEETTYNITLENYNLIFTNSIRNNDYRIAGMLDLPALQSHISYEKENILFMHHDLLCEENDHTGIIYQSTAMDFLRQQKIFSVFHGHTHRTRENTRYGIRSFGVGSIGKDDLGDLKNEHEQFLEVIINNRNIEAVANWLWRGGSERYQKEIRYPSQNNQFGSSELIPRIPYKEADNYISRHVLPREIAAKDKLYRYFFSQEQITLYNALLKDRLVLFVADAGLGKTVEMQHLAYKFTTEKQYLRPIILPLKYYNGGSILDYIWSIEEKYRTLDPDQFVLIMDGYDELSDAGTFSKALYEFLNRYDQTYICISMRSNFLSSTYSVLDRFRIYQLLELSKPEIDAELSRAKIDHSVFYKRCYEAGLSDILSNPFYLNITIASFHGEKALPNKSNLIRQIIDNSFINDSDKFEYSTPLKERQYDTRRALIRFAYGLQLLNRSGCNNELFNCIIKDESDRAFIKTSSIIVTDTNGLGFSHNIFKEYLVGEYLSSLGEKCIIESISIPGTSALNPNWANVLGIILQSNSSPKLIAWIQQSEPLMITKLEDACVTPEMRYKLLCDEVSKINQQNTWFSQEICSVSRLAAFTESCKAVDLLLQQIESPVHFRALHFCLSVLSDFQSLYGMDNKAQAVLVNCYQSETVRDCEKSLAIAAIAKLNLDTKGITDDLINRFSKDSTSDTRLGVYEYLAELHILDDNVDFLLHGIKYISYSYQDNNMRNGSENYELINCLKQLSSPEAIGRALEWFSAEDNHCADFYERDVVLSTLCSKAACEYLEGNEFLFDIVFKFMTFGSQQYNRQYTSSSIIFFKQTKTIGRAFKRIVSEDAIPDIYSLISEMIQAEPELVNIYCEIYKAHPTQLQNAFKDFAICQRFNKEVFIKCKTIIKEASGEDIQDTIEKNTYDGYAERKRKDKQKFFDALFNPDAMHALAVQLTHFYSVDDIAIGQLDNKYPWKYNLPEGTNSLFWAMRCSVAEDIFVKDFISRIDWTKFFVDSISRLIRGKAFDWLIVSQEHRQVINKIYYELESNIDYHTAITEGNCGNYSCQSELSNYLLWKETFNFASPDRFFIGLLEIPSSLANSIDNIEDKYELIEKHIAPDRIKEKIKLLVPTETRTCILSELLFGCNRYKINKYKDIAIKLCQRSEISIFYRRASLEYILDIFGAETLVEEVMYTADTALFEEIVNLLKDNIDNRVIEEMVKRFKSEPTSFLINKLIFYNRKEGLQYYIEESRKINRVMDHSDGLGEVTRTISSIHDINLLPLLMDALRMRFSGSFIDDSFYALSNSLYNAFIHCAVANFADVKKTIESLKIENQSNKDLVGFCNILLNDICARNKNTLLKKWTPNEVRNVIYSIQ